MYPMTHANDIAIQYRQKGVSRLKWELDKEDGQKQNEARHMLPRLYKFMKTKSSKAKPQPQMAARCSVLIGGDESGITDPSS